MEVTRFVTICYYLHNLLQANSSVAATRSEDRREVGVRSHPRPPETNGPLSNSLVGLVTDLLLVIRQCKREIRFSYRYPSPEC